LLVPGNELMREGEHLMTVCNSCRYCEGYCAVFPAMELRLNFTDGDLRYLANLCHNCSACYYACQYAPPHEFAINPARTFAKIRVESYRKYAWPKPLDRAFTKNGLVVSLLLGFTLCVFLLGASLVLGPKALLTPVPGGSFYQITSHRFLVVTFGGISLVVVFAWIVGFIRFWHDSDERLSDLIHPLPLIEALKDVLKLEYLNAGGGCADPREQPSQARRWFHQLTFYGFLLSFAATLVAAIYHSAFGWIAPYRYTSLPVLLGTLGGMALLIGPSGLYVLERRRNRATRDESQYGMDMAFLALLVLTSLTGLLLLVFRGTAGVGSLLVIHLGVVMALFLSLPYGKFIHGVYRSAALVKYALERSRPRGMGSG
jgi:citrate/tricarballylate utilization protein